MDDEEAGKVLNALIPNSKAELVGLALALASDVLGSDPPAAFVESLILASHHEPPKNVTAHLGYLRERGWATTRTTAEKKSVWRLTAEGKKQFHLPTSDAEVMKVDKSIQSHIERVDDPEARAYLNEVGAAIRVGAHRVAVVALWSAVVYHLMRRMEERGWVEVNRALGTHFPGKYRQIRAFDDLQQLKESDLMLVCNELGIVGKARKDIFQRDYLMLRNKCGHPSDFRPTQKTVEAFATEAIENVFAV
jgi:DNA-binding PadR family transcriptional regulator